MCPLLIIIKWNQATQPPVNQGLLSPDEFCNYPDRLRKLVLNSQGVKRGRTRGKAATGLGTTSWKGSLSSPYSSGFQQVAFPRRAPVPAKPGPASAARRRPGAGLPTAATGTRARAEPLAQGAQSSREEHAPRWQEQRRGVREGAGRSVPENGNSQMAQK